MVELTAKNLKTGEVVDFTTDWMFDDRYSYFITENKYEWKIKLKNGSKDDVVKSLPNDEKVKTHIDTFPYYGTCTTEYNEGFEDGVKWLKEKLANFVGRGEQLVCPNCKGNNTESDNSDIPNWCKDCGAEWEN